MKEGNYLKKVRDQYEDYPYPARNPETEKGLLYASKSSSLDCLNYYCFEGKGDFSKKFRVLVAGGGTGDCAIYLAEQLRETKAEIVYLDMTAASMKIAQKRALVRKLENITWVHDSILNIPQLNIGKFDFITCTGVLHHMEEPKAGLDALKSVLHENGSMYIMLYAKAGRTGVYQMQDMLRRINSEVERVDDKILNTKKILKALPPGNWFSFNSIAFTLDLESDIGIYDLLLHSQDRAYSVPELYEFIENSGLKINKLFNPDHPLGDMVFNATTYIRDPELLKTILALPFKEQAAICELMFGQLMKQCCFVSFKDKNTPSLNDLELIPSIGTAFLRVDSYQQLKSVFLGKEKTVQVNQMFSINRTPHMAVLFSLIDGERKTREIVEEAIQVSKSQASFEQVFSEFKLFLDVLLKIGTVYLRSSKVQRPPTILEMEERMHRLYGRQACLEALQKHQSQGATNP